MRQMEIVGQIIRCAMLILAELVQIQGFIVYFMGRFNPILALEMQFSYPLNLIPQELCCLLAVAGTAHPALKTILKANTFFSGLKANRNTSFSFKSAKIIPGLALNCIKIVSKMVQSKCSKL